jgi:hypothetical protein
MPAAWVRLPEIKRQRLRQLLAQLMARTLLTTPAREVSNE